MMCLRGINVTNADLDRMTMASLTFGPGPPVEDLNVCSTQPRSTSAISSELTSQGNALFDKFVVR